MFLCLLPMGAGAQDTHWQCDPYLYRYDMTAYLTLQVNGSTDVDLSGFEVAAFVGNECRGVGRVLTLPDGSCVYMRIRSNSPQGEEVSFRVFRKQAQQEITVDAITLTFQSQTVAGMPSSPLILPVSFEYSADVNGDGRLDIADLILAARIMAGIEETTPAFRADANGDGKVSVADLQVILMTISSHIPSE